MKKILSILAVLTLTVAPLAKLDNHSYNQDHELVSNLKLGNKRFTDSQYNYNPSYPSHSSNIDIATAEVKVSSFSWLGDHKDSRQGTTDPYTIDTQNYALNSEKLQEQYSLSFDTTLNYWMNDIGGNPRWTVPKTITLSWDDVTNGTWKSIHYYTNSNHPTYRHSDSNLVETYIRVHWNGNKLVVEGKVRVEVHWNSWASYTTVGKLTINSVSFNSKNLWQTKKKKFIENLSKDFTFVSNTSPNIDSDEKKSIIDGKEVESNSQVIRKHVIETLESSLSDDYNQWMDYVDWKIVLDNNNKVVIVNFQNKNWENFVPTKFPESIKFKVNLKFNAKEIEQKIKDIMEKEFVLVTGTSPNISDTSTETTSGPQKSNHDQVFEEIDRRINQIFGENTAWKNLIKISKNIDDTKNTVMVDFVDHGGNFIEEGQWISHIDMPVKVELTKDFDEKELKKRLQINPGKILNPKSVNHNETMIDHPSYDAESKTFTYHNEVTLTFTSKKGANEILFVNKVAVPVYKNVFRITLKDLRDTMNNKDSKPTTYDIKITQDDESKLEFTIAIDAVSNDIAFKWVGWNPLDDPSQPTYYEQYLLTQPKIKDGDGNLIDNPKYNELIDPKTGLISNFIFVKGPNKYPFALDPLDAQGDKIDPKKGDADSRYLKGYIAEGQVANSGIFNLEIEDAKNIDHIDRVRLNPQNLEEMDSPEPVNPNEKQFSDEGLYHYIIYRKDYVEKLLDPRDPYHETTLATAGSTIHKLLYISNQVKDYGEDFLSLDFMAKNPCVQPFWNTIQSQHLKNFLTPKGVDSKTLELAKYENIISFWYQYVSNVENDKGVPQPIDYKILNDANNIDFIKMNETDEKIIKNKIKNNIQSKWMWWISSRAKYGVDYIISDTKEGKKELDNLDLTDFANNIEEPKTINLFVVAKKTSNILRGEKPFSALNNKDYDSTKIYDLSRLVLNQQIANYSEISLADLKNKYIYQYLLNEVNRQTPAKIKPIKYGEDFVFSLSGTNGIDLMQDPNIDEKLTDFIKNNHSQFEVTVYAKKESLKLEASKTISFVNNFEAPKPPIIKIDISTIFTKLDLGELKDTSKNGYIDKAEIWDALIRLNGLELYPDLKLAEFNLKISDLGDHQYSASVVALDTNPNYQGQVTATYFSTVPPNPKDMKTDISTIFTKLDLGELKDTSKNGYIDKAEIWDALIRLNGLELYPDLKLAEFNLKISDLGDHQYSTSVVALDTNPNYQGQVTAAYFSTVPPNPKDMKTDISTIFTKLDLAELKDTNNNDYIDKREIWNALIRLNGLELNINLKLSEFSLEITDLKNNNYSVLITALDANSYYKGKVIAKYSSYQQPNPEDPDNPDKPDDGDKDEKKFNPINLAWIIPLSVIGLGGVIFGIYWLTRKIKTKHKRMK